MKANKDRQHVTLTLTKETCDRLKEQAAATDRTMAGYIRWVLNEHLRRKERSPD